MKIGIGCDHAGLELKNEIIKLLSGLGIDCVDYGTNTPESVAYPDFGEKVSEAVSSGKIERGIHRDQVEEYLKKRRQQALAARGENESRLDPHGIRDRLLARKNK